MKLSIFLGVLLLQVGIMVGVSLGVPEGSLDKDGKLLGLFDGILMIENRQT